ncbi:MAG: energy-coupling factor transporter ATPase [Clostridia bacterium]
MTAIELKDISYSYNTETERPTKAVDGISLTIEEGEFIALCGHNGSGKSTVARLLNGLFLPSNGDVLIYGMNTKDKRQLPEIRKNVGMVFQNPDNQMIATIVEDDIAFGPENIGLPREEIGKRIEFALDAVGMSEFRQSTPFRLSGGQKQRIAIAGVLAIKPKVLVLDESTAMLDPKGRKEVFEVIKKLNRTEKMTVILITHYMDEAALFDRVIVFDDGHLAFDGTPREVFKNDKELDKIGLKLPRATKLNKHFKECGIDLGEALSTEELLEKIWQYK